MLRTNLDDATRPACFVIRKNKPMAQIDNTNFHIRRRVRRNMPIDWNCGGRSISRASTLNILNAVLWALYADDELKPERQPNGCARPAQLR